MCYPLGRDGRQTRESWPKAKFGALRVFLSESWHQERIRRVGKSSPNGRENPRGEKPRGRPAAWAPSAKSCGGSTEMAGPHATGRRRLTRLRRPAARAGAWVPGTNVLSRGRGHKANRRTLALDGRAAHRPCAPPPPPPSAVARRVRRVDDGGGKNLNK